VVADFLDAGSAVGLDTGCLADLSAPPFFLDLAGGPP
jgi:hypothetical protein